MREPAAWRPLENVSAGRTWQPGDILIRTGADSHVVMFLGWTSDGRIRCVHETSGSINNVTVGTRNAGWPYYRRLN